MGIFWRPTRTNCSKRIHLDPDGDGEVVKGDRGDRGDRGGGGDGGDGGAGSSGWFGVILGRCGVFWGELGCSWPLGVIWG